MATPHVLVWADGDPFTGLNPLMPAMQSNAFMNALTMAYLTTGGNGPLAPELATIVPTRANGGISRDGRTVTFRLRPNLKWSDGKALTSRDVSFTVRLLRDPKIAIADRAGLALVTAVDTPDPATVVFHLAQPYAPIVRELFSDVDAPIVPEHLLRGAGARLASYIRLPVGAGPFRYAAWLPGDRVELAANPYYYRGAPKLAQIVYRIIAGDDAVAAAMRAGDVDMWPATAKDSVDLLNDDPDIHAVAIDGSRPSMVVLNARSPVTRDPAVRQALRLAIDRPSILAGSYRPGDLLGESVLGAAAPDYSPPRFVPFDIAKAQELLDAAGWKPGSDGVRVKRGVRLHVAFAAPAGIATVDRLLEVVQPDLLAAGIELAAQRYPAQTFFASNTRDGIVYGGRFDAAYLSFGQFRQFAPAYFNFGQLRVADLEQLYGCKSIPPAGANCSRLCDPALEALFDRYNGAFEPKAASAAARAIQARLDALLPTIVVSRRSEYYILRNTIEGFAPQPFSPFGGLRRVDVTK